jgi:hypothetical protein
MRHARVRDSEAVEKGKKLVWGSRHVFMAVGGEGGSPWNSAFFALPARGLQRLKPFGIGRPVAAFKGRLSQGMRV